MATKPYTDKALTGVCLQAQQNGGFVAEDVLDPVAARQQTGVIARRDAEADQLRGTEDIDTVAKGGLAKFVDVDVDTTTTYYCKKRQLKKAVPWEDLANMDSEFLAHSDAATELADRLALNKEIRLVAAITANLTVSGTTTSTLTGTDQWSDYTNSDPLTYLEGKMALIEERGAGTPSRLVLGARVARVLMLHPDVRSTGGGVIRPEEEIGALENMQARLRSVLGLERVSIARSVRNVAIKGQAKSIEAVWGRGVLLYSNTTPSLTRTHSGLGMTIKWNTGGIGRGTGGMLNGLRVQRWTDDDAEAEIIKLTDFYEQKITNPLAGYWTVNAIAAP